MVKQREARRGRSTRALWVLVLSVLGGVAWWRTAGAQPMLQQVATDAGVLVAVPEGLRATPGLSAWPDTAPQVVGLATFTDGAEEPLNIQIRRGEPHGWESLPAANAELAAEWARRFAAELPEASDVTPGNYDAERGALSLQYKLVGPSSARLMQRLPDAHPFWAPTLAEGEDPRIAKCLLDALLAGQPSASDTDVRARVPAAAGTCSLPEAMVAEYLQQLGTAEFAPAVTTVTQLSFFTRFGTIAALVMAPRARQQAVDDAAAMIWRETEVADDARLPVESGTDLYRLAQLGGIVVGAVLGVLLLGAGLSWGLVRLGVRVALAVGGTLGLLCALALLGWLRGGLLLEGGLQLSGYLLTSALVFRPLVRWLSTRGGSPPGPASPLGRARSLRRSRGLSTVEYVVVLVLIACVAIGAWQVFGGQVKKAIFSSGEHFDSVVTNASLDNFGPGGGPRSGSTASGNTASGNAASGNAASGNAASGNAASGTDGPGRRSGAGADTPRDGARRAARGTTGGPTAASDSGSARPGRESRGNAAQGAGTGVLQGALPGPVVAPVAPPTALPPGAGRVVASAAKEPSLLLRGADFATDVAPVVSNIKDATIALTGVNPVTGEKVGALGRVVSGVFAIPGPGNLLKYVGKGGKYVFKGGKAAYEAVQTARAATKLAEATAKAAEREALEAAARATEKELAQRAEKELAQRAEKEAAQRAEKKGSEAIAGTAVKDGVNPKEILFSQPTISQNFSDGHTINQTVEALRSGKLKPTDLPPIRVVEKDGKLITLDNRRLATFTAAGVEKIPVQRVSLSDPKIAAEFEKKFNPVNGGRHVVVVPDAAGRKEAERVLREHGKIQKR